MFTRIALIAALRHELQPLLATGNWRQEKIAGRNFYRRDFAGKEIVATTSGLGKVMAAATTQMLIDRFQADLVLNFGSCGALDPELVVGDLVLASQVIEYDFTSEHKAVPTTECDAFLVSQLSCRFPEFKVGPLASADRNADTVAIRESLFTQHQAVAADWEGASIVRVARRMGIPALVLRGVTDIGDADLAAEYESNYKTVLPRVAKVAARITTFLAEMGKGENNAIC
ncbi:MAG: 5'-methylthioadenosine/S-adenosylhomocysteine nucleosidase [Deltaproteobacteria bacterium]|nr:5'-methylthioadenosine/S-adenosylhomocysteine nucleosidase [Candidatus Tharpella sp.]